MQDRTPTKPNRVLIKPEDGSPSFYATMTRADEPTQVGDPLNKATFLKDETAALFGLDSTAVPDDVFKKAGRVVTGSYVGTGTYGASNPTVLNLPFRPKLVLVSLADDTTYEVKNRFMILVDHGTTGTCLRGDDANGVIGQGVRRPTFFNNGVSWYTSEGSSTAPATQGNTAGTTYGYVAIG